MKGIILAGGKGTRLYPMTKAVSKPLFPVYDKPMVYYPLTMLLLAGIKDILVISTPRDLPTYEYLLGDGSDIGVKFTYKEQPEPRGIGDAFIIGEDFIGSDMVCLVLGDNLFYGKKMPEILRRVVSKNNAATIFGHPVDDPRSFGVVEFDEQGKVLSIEEKPQNPKSKYAVPGLYFYDNKVVEITKHIPLTEKGELDITAINNEYLKKGELSVELLDEVAWFDTGTPAGMLKASEYVANIQYSTGKIISCIEEVAYKEGFISKEDLFKLGEELKMTEYGQYLLNIAK